MFNKINKYKFWISGGIILILGLVFLGGMLRFIGFGPKKEPRGTLLQTAKQYYLNGLYKKAMNAYEKVLVLEPENTTAVLDLAIIYDDYLIMDERAIELYKQYLELSPNSKKKKLIEGWIKDSANDSLGVKTDAELDKMKQMEKDAETIKKENELLKEQVETLSGKLYNIQTEHGKEIKKLQEENNRLSSEFTSTRIRMGRLSSALASSENAKKNILEKLQEYTKNAKTTKTEKQKELTE